MPGSQDAKSRICQLLDMEDKELMAELEGSFASSDKCDERITSSIEDMIQEVDRLLFKIEKLEGDEKTDETDKIDKIDQESDQG